jgi:hypothetical protein
MRKELEQELLKHAEEVVDTSLLSSPVIQSLILGGMGYLGSRYVYDKFSNNPWQKKYIDSIQDPAERDATRVQLQAERDKKKNMWGIGTGLTAALLPLLNNTGTIKDGWKEGKDLWGGTSSYDKGVGAVSGAIAAAIGGGGAVDNMREESRLKERRISDFNKYSSELSYIYDFLEKRANAENDAFYGMNIKMPYVRPLYTHGFADIPVASSMKLIDSNAQAMGQEVAGAINNGLNTASGGLGAGLISTESLIKGLTRAGFGYAGGNRLGAVLGTVFAQPPQVKEQLKNVMGIAGIVLNSGIIT